LWPFGIFYGHLLYFTDIYYILWPFGNVVVIWHIFPPFWYIASRKIWQPWSKAESDLGAALEDTQKNNSHLRGSFRHFRINLILIFLKKVGATFFSETRFSSQ
jgi:hypothetical protein